MTARKINAGLSLLTTVLLMDHAIFFSAWMLSRCRIASSSDKLPWILAGLMVIHAGLSIVLAVRSRKGIEKNTGKSYPKMNRSTYIQRITAMMMLLLLGLHISGAANHFQPKILHAIVHPLFFAAVLAHVSVSSGKALITLGIGNAGVIRIVDAAMKILCGITFAAGVVGFYLCLFMGVAK